ncbi:MAG: tetratricopeptide repeat protein [Planctomycetota bacterium]|jgi:tetratricopeptide (TPR) repeat protein
MAMRSSVVWILVPVCLLLGAVAGFALKGGDEATRTPDADAARVTDLEQANERLRRELSEARLELDALKAVLSGGESEAGDGADPVASAGESAEPRRAPLPTPEEIAKAKEALPGIEYHLSANPTDPALLKEYLRTAARAGEYDAAIEKFEALLEKNPDNPDILTQLGRAYLFKTRVVPNMMEQGKLAFTALDRFDAAIEKHPEHLDSRFMRAVTNYSMPKFMNRIESSVKDFEKLVELSGTSGDSETHGEAYAWLGRAYLKSGKTEEAKKAIDKGIELYPGNEDLRAAQERLEQSERPDSR